jgi:4-hydroxyphenylpyruvate dioxygenase-like putative hemolysin
MTAAMAPMSQLNATDLCDRCGAQAYVRVVLSGSGQLLFCAHHARQHGEALAKVAVEIQDETDRLARSETSGTTER